MSPHDDPTKLHYWLPIPEPDGRRHAFRGARRWNGQSAGEAVCGEQVAMAVPSETDWIHRATCRTCWDVLVAEQCGRDAPPPGER